MHHDSYDPTFDFGPVPAPMPAASAWEWGALIAVALDGRPLSRSAARTSAGVRATSGDRAVVAIVAGLAVTAAVLSALLI